MECSSHHVRFIIGLIEILFTVLTFALSFAGRWDAAGGGYVDACGIACFLFILIWLILRMTKVIPQTFVFFAIELGIYCFMVVLLLAAGILAAVIAGQLALYVIVWPYLYQRIRDIIAACSFFAFASAVLCGIDIGLLVQQYREGNFPRGTAPTSNPATNNSFNSNGEVSMG